MGFFDPPPPPASEPEPARVPDWAEAPQNQIGGPVPIRLLLARTDDVAVAVLGAAAYPSGLEFVLSIRMRSEDGRFDPWDESVWSHRGNRAAGEGLPDELFRFGVEFSDGRRVTTLSGPGDDDDEPSGPVLSPGGGRGGPGSWDSDYWLWPLPPPGPLAFVCEWPARGIALTRAEVDADVIREAATHAETLWPPQSLRGGFRAARMTALEPDTPAPDVE